MQVIDLSLPVTNEMPGVNIRTARQLDPDGWNATTLQLYSHAGTHMDAPRHFLPDGKPLDQQDLNVLVGPALVVNLAPAAPRELITVKHLASVADSVSVFGACLGVRALFRGSS